MKFNFKAKKIKSKAVALLLCFALMSALVSCGDAQDVPNTEVSTETGAQTST